MSNWSTFRYQFVSINLHLLYRPRHLCLLFGTIHKASGDPCLIEFRTPLLIGTREYFILGQFMCNDNHFVLSLCTNFEVQVRLFQQCTVEKSLMWYMGQGFQIEINGRLHRFLAKAEYNSVAIICFVVFGNLITRYLFHPPSDFCISQQEGRHHRMTYSDIISKENSRQLQQATSFNTHSKLLYS